ncbi:MAG TPA: T9SS type A sorting domain-containing protein [Ignavibacteria bacterium]|nr:T9SS type A sorting domain-containing protein [Ignavibacteria bacterium]HMQ99752.1 T9SS type A sorting domain-containing protein [Ignavibacteria bacterium]
MKHPKINVLLTIIFLTYGISYSQSWVQQFSGSGSSLKSLAILDENTVLVCGFSGTILKSTNGGLNWISKNSSNFGALYTLKFFNLQTGYAIGGTGTEGVIYKTTNSGENWSGNFVVMDSLQGFFRCNFYSENIWYSIALVDVEFYGTATAIYKTTNSGLNWVRKTFLVPTEYITEVNFVNELTGHFVTRRTSIPLHGFHYVTTNGGTNWSYNPLGGNAYSVIFRDANTGFTGGEGGYIWKSTNGGFNWSIAQCCPGGLQGAFSFPSANTGYSAGYGKIYKTTNGGINWMNASASFTNIVYYDIKFLNDTVGYCVGDAGTILKTTNGGVTAVQQTSTEIPQTFSLSQNFPNPFNPVTSINFDIPYSSFSKLTVFDQIGREIQVLVNEQLSPGSYKYEWNASDYPSGIYFYKLQAGDFAETKKMVLIK